MEKSSFFNSVGGDRKYKASDYAEYFSSFIGNGIFPNPSNNLQVMANNDMTVTLKAGKAWINGYFYVNTDDLVLSVDVADGVLNRIDRVVIRLNTVAREIKAVVKKGTFASSPVAPVLQRDADAYELGIADIYIGKGAISISQANITDLRFNNNYCGIVKGTVDQIDTTNLFAQYDDAFNTWFETLQDMLDDNVAANLLNLINQNTSDLEQVESGLIEHLADTAQNAHLAKNIGIEDTAGNFTANDVEGALNELFTSVSDGKTQLETTITDKGGTVSKSGSVATFDELDDGIRSIPVGDYAVGDTIKDSVLMLLAGGMGVEIWSKTDVIRGQGIAVDSVGNVYVAHYVDSGKAVRKLDSGGNEVWSKTDVPYGWGIAVDSVGNVYVAHGVDNGGKAVRKLDQAGNEIWSKTDVIQSRGIAVDSAGNVYVAHGVISGKAVRKLDSGGNEVWSKTDVPYGWGIAVDSVGNVYVAHGVDNGGKAVRKLDQAGNEIWSKTDVPNGLGIAVDSAGNVYVTHGVSAGGKTVRKLDQSGNEIWSNTDVPMGYGIAVDGVGNVYVAHYVDSGGKAVRKLDQAGNEIWSKTDVIRGQGIAVDSVGNVYVAHYVDSGKAVRKLDGNKYFQIAG